MGGFDNLSDQDQIAYRARRAEIKKLKLSASDLAAQAAAGNAAEKRKILKQSSSGEKPPSPISPTTSPQASPRVDIGKYVEGRD